MEFFRKIGLLFMAIGFVGFTSTNVMAIFGTYINPATYVLLGVIGTVVIFASLIYERIQDKKKDDHDDLSQY